METLFNALVNSEIAAGNLPIDYDTSPGEKITLETIDTSYCSRSWSHQVCTEYGWFQVANSAEPMRPVEVDLTYYKDWCERVFPGLTMGDVFPRTTATTISQGGFMIGATNTFFSVGCEDPW